MVARLRGKQAHNQRALSRSHIGERRARAVQCIRHSAGAGFAVSGQADKAETAIGRRAV